MEKAFFLLKSIKLYHVINLPDIRFTNNAVLHLNNFIPILRLLETTFLYSQILEKMGYVSFIQFHSIRLSRMSHNFVFFFFFFVVSLPLMHVSWFIFLKIFPVFKDGASSKILRFLPVIFSSQRSRQKKRRQGNEEREITEGTAEK